MDDQAISDRVAQLSAQYPPLNSVVSDVLSIDQDGLLISSEPVVPSDSSVFVPDLSSVPTSPPSVPHLQRSVDNRDYFDNLQLVLPSAVPGREALISDLSRVVLDPDPVKFATLIRDLIYAVRTCPCSANQRRGRSASRPRDKPTFESVRIKLQGLTTRSGQPMLSDKWIRLIHDKCESQVLHRMLAVDKLGNLALSLKGSRPNQINDRISRHLDLLG